MTQRIYLIDAGAIARSHVHALQSLPVAEQIHLAVADPNADVLAAFALQFPWAQTFSDALTMLAETAQETDIVIVATPPFTHYELSCAALMSGRHVLCEKPLAMDREQAQDMFALARAKQRFLGCCSVRYFESPTTEAARRLLQENTLGQLYHVRFRFLEQRNRPGIEYQPETRWFLERAKSGGGTLMDRAPYEFSLLNDLLQPVRVDVLVAWLTNPITALKLPATAINDVEHHAGATLRYHLADGTTFIMSYERSSATHSEEESTIELTGLKGSLHWQWPQWDAKRILTHTYDRAGQAESQVFSFPHPGKTVLSMSEKPLHYFYRRVSGQPSLAVVNEQALFNFSCVRALYDCASTGETQSVIWTQ